MTDLLLKSSKSSVGIKTDIPEVVDYFRSSVMPNVFIPDYSISDKKQRVDEFYFEFVKNNDGKRYLEILPDQNKCVICDDWSKGVPTYVLSLLNTYLGRILAEKSIFTFHSSSVQGKNNYVFLGHAGVGKTTVMLELVTRADYKYISNNKTLVFLKSQEVTLLGGTLAVSLREKEISDKLKPFINDVEITPYGRPVFIFRPESRAKDLKNRKTNFVFLRLNPGVSEFYKVGREESLFKLYPFFLDLVDREIALFDYSTPLPSQFKFDEILKKNILAGMRSFVESNEVFHLSGSLDFIKGKIDELDRNP